MNLFVVFGQKYKILPVYNIKNIYFLKNKIGKCVKNSKTNVLFLPKKVNGEYKKFLQIIDKQTFIQTFHQVKYGFVYFNSKNTIDLYCLKFSKTCNFAVKQVKLETLSPIINQIALNFGQEF